MTVVTIVTIFSLLTRYIKYRHKRYEELSTSAALRSERITCQLRNLVFTISSSGKSDYLKQAADVQGIQISSSEQILTITLPGLLPKRKVRTNTASSMHNIIKLYLNGDTNSSYYLGLSARAKDGSLITTVDDMVARFRADGVSNTHDGTITLSRVASSSTNKKYKQAGAFTGTLTFDIIGSYY